MAGIMSLTLGNGPLAKPPRGSLNFDLGAAAPAHVLYLHEVPQRIRGRFAGQTVVDTRRAMLLHETGLLPQWYVPLEDVRQDLIERTDHTTHCPFKGDASYWTLRVGDRVAGNTIWGYENPKPECPPLAGLVAFYFDRLDAWFEEDEPVLGHPRDPFHRVDVRRTSRHVVVRAGGQTVADSRRALALFETGLPTRYYLPASDVRMAALRSSTTTTVCPYKGVATYHDVCVGDTVYPDAAWSYHEPLAEARAVGGLLSFLGEGIEVTVDGEPG
ncbi:hypothetical protein GTS_53920 [Gandjariella thermophila]|uniref:DUF427 domain-containing protein n=2 Tax=Gandjariella thermophila TaxID=1931992 RepID=A0A4D4JHJ9_9PSEU|nr:hypothetical protein GTS_53920 [Gandjariella thermophila]